VYNTPHVLPNLTPAERRMTNLTVRPSRRPDQRPAIRFVAMSTETDKIRFLGNLMPALLLLRQSPREFGACGNAIKRQNLTT
jgi:hypothetical protein